MWTGMAFRNTGIAIGFYCLLAWAAAGQAASPPATAPSAPSSPAAQVPAAASSASPKLQTEAEKDAARLETLQYGIDSEVVDLIRTLDAEKEAKFNDALLLLFQKSRNVKIRTAVLSFFGDLETRLAEADAADIVATRDRQDSGLVAASLQYLAQIRSKAALAYAAAIIKDNDKKLLPALIRLIGRAGGPDEESLLLDWMGTDAPSEELKQSAIDALGEFGSSKAADKLMKIVEDSNQGKATRMKAAAALGKIKDERAIASLVIAFNGEDPNVRQAALSALAEFSSEESRTAVLSGLRDSSLLVRSVACKACGKLRLQEAVPALKYKAQNDPEKAVKSEALKALAEIGDRAAFDFLQAYLSESKNDSSLRIAVFGLLSRKDPSALPLLEARLSAEAKEKDRAFYTALAREVANAQDAPGIVSLARILLRDSDYLIRVSALEWARKTRVADFKDDLALAAEKDPSEYIRKRAVEILGLYK